MKKYIISLFIVFCLINGLAAQDENADALYLKQKKEFVLNTDGTYGLQLFASIETHHLSLFR